MNKVLIGSVIWAPATQTPRAEVILRHFACLKSVLLEQSSISDILLIHNECGIESDTSTSTDEGTHPLVLGGIKDLESLGAKTLYYSPQLGWTKGRNSILQYFLNHPEYSHVAMTDCDQSFANSSWVSKILELALCEPELEAYMIRPDKYQRHLFGSLVGPSDGVERPISLYQEWLGTTNVLTRRAVEVVGGFDCVTFTNRWGFTDPEYGRRLRKSGLLARTNGWYCDPIEIAGDHMDCIDYQEYLSEMKSKTIPFMGIYNSTIYAVETGKKPVWFDPATDLPGD